MGEIKKHDPALVFPAPRRMYEDGAPLGAIKRRFKLTDSELRDVCPEEFEDDGAHPTRGY